MLRGLSVRENLELGGFTVAERGTRRERLEHVFSLFPILEGAAASGRLAAFGRRAADAGHRPGADARPEGAAARRALHGACAEAGARDVAASSSDLNEAGTTILLVEQNARLALKLAHYGYVLETGSIRMDSDADTLAASNSIVEAYLGA